MADTHVDELPLDPEARVAAIAKEADCYRLEIEALTEDVMAEDDEPTDEARSQVAYDGFKLAVVRLALHPNFEPHPHAVISGLLDVAIAMMRLGVRAEPSTLPVLQAQARHVLESITPVEIPDGPLH